MPTSDPDDQFDRTGMRVLCNKCDFARAITQRGEEAAIEAQHSASTGHGGFDFHYSWGTPEETEAHARSEWEKEISSKRLGHKARWPGFDSTCSKCKSSRPCILHDGEPFCFNCSRLLKRPIRRLFYDKTNLSVIMIEGYEVPAWRRDDMVDDQDLPHDKYFFRFEKLKDLLAIRKSGLASTDTFHKYTAQDGSKTFAGETRLFLYPEAGQALYHVNDWDRKSADYVPTVALRFRRSLLRGKEKIFDGGYGAHIFSIFVRDTVVPPSEIQVCSKHAGKRWSDLAP